MARIRPALMRLRRVPRSLYLLVAVLLAGAALRVLFMFAWRPALIGYPDARGYIAAAQDGVFNDDSLRTAGYPMFLRVLHAVGPDLRFAVLVQHALGLAAGLLLYLTVRRGGAGRWAALLPLAVVSLNGAQLFIEHTPLTEALFVFLVGAALYCATRTLDERVPVWTVAATILLAYAVTVRVVALPLLVLFVVWLLLAHPGPWRGRLVRAGTSAAVALAVLVGYMALHESQTGYFGFSRAGAYNVYGRVAPFADCSKFDPPKGTRALCEATRPEDRRGGPEQYIFAADVSPAVRAFGTPFEAGPERSAKVAAFARAAILGQPWQYTKAVAQSAWRYVAPGLRGKPGYGSDYEQWARIDLFDPAFSGEVSNAVARYYGEEERATGVREDLLEALFDFERAARVQGPLMVVLVLLMLAAPFVTRARDRRIALLVTGFALALLLVPVMTLTFSARFAVPAYGPLAAAAALGASGLVRSRRLAPATEAQDGEEE